MLRYVINMSNVTLTRLTELKNRLELLIREAESIVSNVRCCVKRGNSVVALQESIHEIEHFLRCYPVAGTEIDHLINILVKLNCELEITLARRSDFCNVLSTFEDNSSELYESVVLGKRALCEECSKEKNTVGTSTDNVTELINEFDREEIEKLYDIDENSIFEMKYLQGDGPSQFWLGYYCNNELLSHLAEINRKLQLGELHRIVTTPVVGQYIIGYVDRVFRGCVISVSPQIVVTVDVDTAALKLLNVHDIWEIGDYLSCFPPRALHCKLWGVEGVVDWTNHLSTFFKKCLSNCNLVITIKDIIPGAIPTFLVDVDAHDSTFMDVNLTEWINSFVSPAIEKIKLFGLSGATEETVFQDLDPYVIYRAEDSSDIDSSLSDQNIVGLSDVKMSSEVKIQVTCDPRRNEKDIDSNCVLENLEETPVRDSSNLIFNSITDNNEIPPGDYVGISNVKISSEVEIQGTCDPRRDEKDIDSNCAIENLEETPVRDSSNLILNSISDNSEIAPGDYVNDNNTVTKNSQLNQVNYFYSEDDVSNAFHEQANKLVCKELKPCEQSVRSSTVKCFLEKNQTLGMSFLKGKGPWNFFLSNVSLHEIDILKKKMAERAEHGLLIPFPNVPERDDFAIAKFNNEYYRVCISSISEQNSEEVILGRDVDTGDYILVSTTDLWVLEEMFSLPPARAVSCSLWNISRNILSWCADLENLFKNVMSRGACYVNVKDVECTSGNWNHIVQIEIYTDCVFDVSEWIMNFIFPNLKNIEQSCINSINIGKDISMLDPSVIYCKERKDNSYSQKCVNNQISSEVAKTSPSMKLPISEHKTELLKSSQTLPKVKSFLANALKVKDDFNFKDRSHTIVPKKKYYVFMASIVSPSEFYVHIISEENSFIDRMHEELSRYCSHNKIYFKTKKEARQLIPESCAVHFKDQWFRARIIHWFDDSSDSVTVFLVDYGVQTTVSFCLIQPLRSDFYDYPVFAERCALALISPPHNNDSWPENSLKTFSNLLDFNTVYEIYVATRLELGILCVFLFNIDVEKAWCVNDYLVEKGCAVSEMGVSKENETENSHVVYYPIIDSGIDETTSDSDSIEDCHKWENMESMPYFDNNTAGLPGVGEQFPVILTEIVNMCSFYAVHAQIQYEGRLQSTHEVLMKMNGKITSAVQSGQLKLSKRLSEGAIAVARYSKDKNWYRARLLASPADNGDVEVFFVDYGNVDTVHKFYIREIRKDFCELPFQAMRFFVDSIDITKLKDKHSREIAQTLMTSLVDKFEVMIKVTGVDNEAIKVKVFFEGRDIGAEMVDLYVTQCQ